MHIRVTTKIRGSEHSLSVVVLVSSKCSNTQLSLVFNVPVLADSNIFINMDGYIGQPVYFIVFH